MSRKVYRKKKHIVFLLVAEIFLLILSILFCFCIMEYKSNKNLQTEFKEEDIVEPVEDFQITEPEPKEVQEEVDYVGLQANEILSEMTLDEKIYQLFIVTPEQLTGVSKVTQAGETTKKAIQNHPVGGVIYFASNIVNREQCEEMINNLQSYSPLPLFIVVDEEGGKVARVGNNSEMNTTKFPEMGEIGAGGSIEDAYQVGNTIGTELLELGFNLDLAPDADINSNPENPVIGKRAFSSDPEKAAEMVGACVRGFCDSGILCTLKHFPGHGDTSADSHYGEAEISKNLDDLQNCEFIPFIAGIEAGAQLVMVGHITAPNVVDEPVPSSLSSYFITELLRNQIGFKGLIITDSFQMHAITDQYDSGTAAVKALKAGVDIILMPLDLKGAVNGIKMAIESGELQESRLDESVLRILCMKIESGIIIKNLADF